MVLSLAVLGLQGIAAPGEGVGGAKIGFCGVCFVRVAREEPRRLPWGIWTRWPRMILSIPFPPLVDVWVKCTQLMTCFSLSCDPPQTRLIADTRKEEFNRGAEGPQRGFMGKSYTEKKEKKLYLVKFEKKKCCTGQQNSPENDEQFSVPFMIPRKALDTQLMIHLPAPYINRLQCGITNKNDPIQQLNDDNVKHKKSKARRGK